ncbi:hypothetical protein AAFF_G00208110, partial [Aldrovandia affinis]
LSLSLCVCVNVSLSLSPAEVHPLLGVKGDSKSKKKSAGRPKGSKGKERERLFKGNLASAPFKPHEVQGLD